MESLFRNVNVLTCLLHFSALGNSLHSDARNGLLSWNVPKREFGSTIWTLWPPPIRPNIHKYIAFDTFSILYIHILTLTLPSSSWACLKRAKAVLWDTIRKLKWVTHSRSPSKLTVAKEYHFKQMHSHGLFCVSSLFQKERTFLFNPMKEKKKTSYS